MFHYRHSVKKRSVPRFLFEPASKWTRAEYDFLNVDDEVAPWRDMLNDKVIDEDLLADETLQKLLNTIEKRASDVTGQDMREIRSQNKISLAKFYFDLKNIIRDVDDDELDQELNESPPSPKQLKRLRYTEEVKPTGSLTERPVPKSSSLQSITSITSEIQGQREGWTRTAFFFLLDHIFQFSATKFPGLLVQFNEFVYEIELDFIAKTIHVENDGNIFKLSTDGVSAAATPFVNVECKSRDGYSSLEIYDNIFAQEFAEMYAIMLARVKAMTWEKRVPGDMSNTVYSIGVHHRRAYLSKVTFDLQYLKGCQTGSKNERRVTVVRSENNYRLDDVQELRELVTMIYCLCSQLQNEIRAGRVV